MWLSFPMVFIRVFVLALTFLISLFPEVEAQRGCATEIIEQQRRLPGAAERFEQWMSRRLREAAAPGIGLRGMRRSGEPDLIPVVVHIIHNGEAPGTGSNIPDAQILSQIEVINEDFQRLNADTTLTQPAFVPIAGSLNIRFVLALRDPAGLPTNGIQRVNGNKSSWNLFSTTEMSEMKALSYWPAEDYLNIWVTTASSGYLGIAQYPDIDLPGLEEEQTENRLTDGIVIDYRNFGSVAKEPGLLLRPKYALGRTATHELGHFFGLRHVWGDKLGDINCDFDDYVNDTPPSSRNYDGECPFTGFSCGNTDMTENYLYYTDDACMNAFSSGQVERMQVVLASAPRRASLLNAPGAFFPQGDFTDLAVAEVLSPGVATCSTPLRCRARVENRGTLEINSFTLQLHLDGVSVLDTLISGIDLIPGASLEVEFRPVQLSEGQYHLIVESGLEAPDIDLNPANNRAMLVFALDTRADFIPLRENFESGDLPTPGWTVVNPDLAVGWRSATAPHVNSGNRAALMELFNYPVAGQIDWLYSNVLDFSAASEASLFFSVSHRQHPGRTDRLQIWASGDCGQNYRMLKEYRSPEMASGTSSQFWLPAGADDWKRFSIDLGSYAGLSDVRLAFSSVNGFGNNIYLDDIEFFATAPEHVLDIPEDALVAYPNPTPDGRMFLAVYLQKRQPLELLVYEASGRMVTRRSFPALLNQTLELDLTGNSPGLYILRLVGDDFVRSKKIAISR